MPSLRKMSPVSRLKPQKITFPAHDADEWAKGDRRTAAFDVSVDKLVSHNLHSAPDIEELVSRISDKIRASRGVMYRSCTHVSCSPTFHSNIKLLRFYTESENSRQDDDGPT